MSPCLTHPCVHSRGIEWSRRTVRRACNGISVGAAYEPRCEDIGIASRVVRGSTDSCLGPEQQPPQVEPAALVVRFGENGVLDPLHLYVCVCVCACVRVCVCVCVWEERMQGGHMRQTLQRCAYAHLQSTHVHIDLVQRTTASPINRHIHV